MHTIETTVYQFDELNDKAKEEARDWYRGCIDSSDYEYTIEDAVRIGEILGIQFATSDAKTYGGKTIQAPRIYWSGFCCQGDGASFEGRYAYAKGAAKAIRKEAPEDKTLHRIANSLQAAQSRHFYKLVAECKVSGHYVHSGCMNVAVEHADDSGRDIGAAEDDVREALREFADWIYAQLDQQNDYLYSEESVDECIRANECEFTKDGVKA